MGLFVRDRVLMGMNWGGKFGSRSLKVRRNRVGLKGDEGVFVWVWGHWLLVIGHWFGLMTND